MTLSFVRLYEKIIQEQGADPMLGGAPATPGADPMSGGGMPPGGPMGAAPPTPGADPTGGLGGMGGQQAPPPQKYTLATEKGAWQILKDYAKHSEEKNNQGPQHSWGKPTTPIDKEKKEFKPKSLRV